MTIQAIPDDILKVVFSYLSEKELVAVEQTCTHWQKLASTVWEVICKRDWPSFAPAPEQNWKLPYQQEAQINSNIKGGKIEPILIPEVFDSVLPTIGKTHFFCTCARGILDWDLKTFTTSGKVFTVTQSSPRRTSQRYQMHLHMALTSLAAKEEKLFAKALDYKEISVWNSETQQSFPPLLAEIDSTLYASAEQNLLFAISSTEKTVHLWNTQTLALIKSAKLEDPATVICMGGGKFFTNSVTTNAVHVRDLTSFKTIDILRKTFLEDPVTSMCVSQGKLFCSSWKNGIEVWDIQTLTHITTFPPKLGFTVISLAAHSGKVFASLFARDTRTHGPRLNRLPCSKIKVYNAGTLTKMQTLNMSKKLSRYEHFLCAGHGLLLSVASGEIYAWSFLK